MPYRILLPAFLFLFSFLPQFPAHSQTLPTGFESIDRHRVYDVCRRLASDEFRGRLTGDSGYTRAAQWIAGMMQTYGLKPCGEKGTFLQPFPAPYSIITTAHMTVTVPGTGERVLAAGKDYLPLLYTDRGSVTAPVVFAGWGISAPSLGYDDYATLDVRGKIVLCFRGVPNGEDSVFQHYDEHRTRMQAAKEKGALGLFYIYENPIANPNGDFISGFRSAIISFETANYLLKERGWTARALQDSLSRSRITRSFMLSSTVTYDVDAVHHADGIGFNVLGYLEGSDPAVNKECVIIGGHLDHCGTHLGLTFAGASDNASGSAVVVEIFRAFASGERPRRSVLFALFGGEEMGLLGSEYLASHLPRQFTTVAAMLNFDMVGTGDGSWCGYSAAPRYIKEALDQADGTVKTIRGSRPMGRVGVRGSDFAPFVQRKIPAYSFSSNGPHLSYHEPGDTIYRINPDMLADMSKLGYLIARQIANLSPGHMSN